MRMIIISAVMALMGVAFASGQGSGEGGGLISSDTLKSLGFHTFNLTLLLGFLFFMLRGRLRDAMKNRSLGVKRAIDEANTMRKEAQARFDQLERQLEGFEHELAEMRKNAEREALAERDTLLKRAEEEAELIKRIAERTIRDETERARAALRVEAATLAVDLAQKQLSSQICAADDQRFAEQFLGAVRITEVADG